MSLSSIPTFVLFGEDANESSAEFAHIETIAIRSSLYDWEISPHRHLRCIQTLFVFRGQVEFHCDGDVRILDAPCFMVVPIGNIHGFRFTPSTVGFVLTLSMAFMSRAAKAGDPLLGLLTHGGAGTIPENCEQRIDWLCRELLTIQADWRAPQPLFLALAEALVRSLPAAAGENVLGKDEERLAGFRRLVELHLRDHNSIAWYAGQLNLTTKTLTRICQRRLGCTPTNFIHGRLVLEAQRLLTFTNATIGQVSDQLGFSDYSYFSRFYRRMTGRRPRCDKLD